MNTSVNKSEKAKQIVKEHEQILASEKDREIFFNAFLNPSKPKEALVKAAKDFDKILIRTG